MSSHNLLSSLMSHMAWADARAWDAVLTHEAARVDTRLLDTLHHMHLVQRAFRSAWSGEPEPSRDRNAFPDASSLAQWGREGVEKIARDVAAMTDEQLAAPFNLPWSAEFETFVGKPAAAHTLGEGVAQVALHTQHHRGQVCTRLRDVGATPPYVDYIIWLWSGRPAG